ncbi:MULTISPECIES: ABC transporter permease [Bacteria]
MKNFGSGTATVAALELRQRVRSVAWYVLLSLFAVILLVVSLLASMVFSGSMDQLRGAYSVAVYIVLLLVTFVSPALSGNAINGDCDQATLAPVQVTLVSTAQILTGKFVAAWATGLAFALVAVPFIVFMSLAGDVPAGVVAASLGVLIVEIGVIAALGVGFSGILNRPLFSVATTYLVVAALTIGTVVAFGLGSAAVRTEVTDRYRSYEYTSEGLTTTNPPTCARGRNRNVRCRGTTTCGGSWRRTRSSYLPTPLPSPSRARGTPSTRSVRSRGACAPPSCHPKVRRGTSAIRVACTPRARRPKKCIRARCRAGSRASASRSCSRAGCCCGLGCAPAHRRNVFPGVAASPRRTAEPAFG